MTKRIMHSVTMSLLNMFITGTNVTVLKCTGNVLWSASLVGDIKTVLKVECFLAPTQVLRIISCNILSFLAVGNISTSSSQKK